jgi:xanthine dehydrogenase accessory factor
VLVEPVDDALRRVVASAREAATAGAPATLWHRLPAGEAPEPPAAGAVRDGRCVGPLAETALGAALEAAAAEASARAAVRCVALAAGGAGGRFFLQPLALPELVILGAGHVGLALDAAARPCGWRTTVIDDRSDFASPARFPHARVVVAPFRQALEGCAAGPATAIVVVTRGHRHDADALASALATEAGYVGLIGSTRKILTVFERCCEWGVPPARLARVFAPIGVGVGAETPAEIAAAVVAELIAVRRLGAERALALNPKAAEVRARFESWLARRAGS